MVATQRFCFFSSRTLGKCIQFYVRIFFRWVGLKPPTSQPGSSGSWPIFREFKYLTWPEIRVFYKRPFIWGNQRLIDQRVDLEEATPRFMDRFFFSAGARILQDGPNCRTTIQVGPYRWCEIYGVKRKPCKWSVTDEKLGLFHISGFF